MLSSGAREGVRQFDQRECCNCKAGAAFLAVNIYRAFLLLVKGLCGSLINLAGAAGKVVYEPFCLCH